MNSLLQKEAFSPFLSVQVLPNQVDDGVQVRLVKEEGKRGRKESNLGSENEIILGSAHSSLFMSRSDTSLKSEIEKRIPSQI